MIGTVFLLSLLIGATARAETPIAIFNGSFESLPPGISADDALGKLPWGWCPTLSPGSAAAVLSDERVFEGRYALKVEVDPAATALTSSKPIPIEGGKTYAALWRIYNVGNLPAGSNQIHCYMEFWGAVGGWWQDNDYWSEEAWEGQVLGNWSNSRRIGVYWLPSRQYDQWEDVVVIGPAPEEATHVTLSLWVPRKTLTSYIDDIQLAMIDE
jgi:hypothetical protein